MIDSKIFQNSYVILFITFVVLCLIFYFFEIGYTEEIENGKIVKQFSWKYPLAISLLVWIVWHFYLYPPEEEIVAWQQTSQQQEVSPGINDKIIGGNAHIQSQKINMVNWC